MAHKILFMSPLHNKGTSVVAALVTQAVSFTNKTSMLVFTEAGSLIPMYFGQDGTTDPTRSIMQIVRLIDNSSIEDKDLLDYATTITQNSYILNLADPSLVDRDRIQVISHVFKRVPTSVVVCDNSDDIDTKFTKTLVEESDMIFVVIETMQKDYYRLKTWLEYPLLKNNPNVYVLINKYSEVVGSMRNIAQYIGFPANKVCKIHYNPWITKCCLNGQLGTILPVAREWDPRAANLLNDIDEINQCIDGSMLMKTKKGF